MAAHQTIKLINPTLVDLFANEAAIKSQARTNIRFSKSCYDQQLLRHINSLCKQSGEKIYIDFYDYQGETFDASCLLNLPDVANLSVDSFLNIEHQDSIYSLKKLREFAFEVYYLRDPNFFDSLDTSNLTYLNIGNTKNSKFDLSFLRNCTRLKNLVLDGDKKNLEAIASLKNLSHLFLRCIPKKYVLSFVNSLESLKKLKISLGGRENIEEIQHAGIEDLEISLVLGLKELGDLSRFTKLTNLTIFGQTKLDEITFSRRLPSLSTLDINSCKNFREINGLSNLTSLSRLSIHLTGMDPEYIYSAELPKSVSRLWFETGKKKTDREFRSWMTRRGYNVAGGE